jgi:hypothetical protein
MENPGILKWRTWPAWRKGLGFGALFGFGVSAFLHGVVLLTSTAASQSTLAAVGWCTVVVAYGVDLPTLAWRKPANEQWGYAFLSNLTGHACEYVILNTVTYALLGCLLACVVSWSKRIFRKLKNEHDKTPPEEL